MKKATTFDLTTLQTNARNPQITTPERLERLRQSLADLPKMMRLRPLVYDPDTMTVLGGNKRLTQLLALGYTTVPAEWVASAHDFTPEERRRFVIADNVGFGDWDAEILTEDYTPDELEAWGLQPDDWGDDPEEQEAPAATDDGYAPPADLPTDIVPGDLITIGPHRLLCGDSINADDVAKVMGGEKANMVFTDPPYNINYVNIKHSKFRQREIKNDNMSASDFSEFCAGFVSNILLFNKGCVYVAGAPGVDGRIMFTECDKAMHCSTVVIWNKDQFTLGRGKYQNKYEPIWFGWVDTGNGFYGDRTQSNVWDIPRPKKADEHPTMKPVELVSRALNHASRKEDSVLDLFLGSGTTMVAAHQLHRRCFGLEIDPKYCQIILDRMLKLDPTLTITRNGKKYSA